MIGIKDDRSSAYLLSSKERNKRSTAEERGRRKGDRESGQSKCSKAGQQRLTETGRKMKFHRSMIMREIR